MASSYTYINSNTTTVVKAAPGQLYSIVINQKGTSGNLATIYDNTAGSGTVIGVLDTTSVVGEIAYNVGLTNGLTIVTATGTAPDITVVYA